jgi:hypothetical protein
VATKILATLIAVYGWLVPAIGWNRALLVLEWSSVEFVVTDFIKVPFLRDFNGKMYRNFKELAVLLILSNVVNS